MNDENKKEDGLPDISQLADKKSFMLVILFVILAGGLGLHFYQSNHVKPEKVSEEIYSVPVENVAATEAPIPKDNAKIKPEKEEITVDEIALIQEKQKALQQRLSAPLMVVNNEGAKTIVALSSSSSASMSDDPNTQFKNQIAAHAFESAKADKLGTLNSLIAEGSLIHATMESAINSDLPGSLRASVNQAVYSEDGTNLLIPVGSRLIGHYKSGMQQGQSRVFVVWTRLITPQGMSVNLASPGVDALGVAGVNADDVNTHFWKRFGTASLLSILGAGSSNLGVSGQDRENSAAAYREAVANSFSQSATESLKQNGGIAPTLTIHQGRPIIVFVAKDLHFANVTTTPQSKIQIF